MENLLPAVKDLLKYNIVSYVNTGDKTMDNLINTLLITILTIVFGEKLKKKLYVWWLSYKSRKGVGSLSRYNFEHYKTEINSSTTQLTYCTWNLMGKENEEFTGKLTKFFTSNLGWKLGSKSAVLRDMTDLRPGDPVYHREHRGFSVISEYLPCSEIWPVFISSNGMVGMTIDGNSTVFIAYENEKVLKDFHRKVLACQANKPPKKKKKEFRPVTVRNYFKQTKYTVYQDRTFDSFVSRHKPTIINALDDFQLAMEGKSAFNGFGTYNLGFMLYGAPGTGKTSVIKAVCNYLQRDGVIVDMRKVKTVSGLEEIFYKHSIQNTVFILEEFDCVQGVIDRSLDESKEDVEKSSKDKVALEKHHLKLLELRKGMKDDSNAETIDQEIKETKKKIEDIDNRITIDALLTVLDGVVEVRGRCVIATTNYIDRIDSALIREGRFDHKINLGMFNDAESREMLETMFQTSASEKDFAYLKKKRLREGEFTPVQIINLCHRYRSLRKVVDHMAEVESPRSCE